MCTVKLLILELLVVIQIYFIPIYKYLRIDKQLELVTQNSLLEVQIVPFRKVKKENIDHHKHQ